MNAAARLVHQGVLSRHLVLTRFLTLQQVTFLALTVTILLSAIGVVYVTHTTRILYANYQQHVIDKNRLHVERGQLLLERSTLLMQSRVQRIAQKQLGMVMPSHKSVVVVHE